MTISRRSFLKTSGIAAAVASFSGGSVNTVLGATNNTSASLLNKWPGRVVVNFNKGAFSGSTVQALVVRQMVDNAMMRLTDQGTVGAAWKAIFPSSLTATSKIAIKIPLGYSVSPCFPHWASVRAIVDGLKAMTINGAAFTGTISIYDGVYSAGDYQPNVDFNGSGYTSANIPGVTFVADNFDASGGADNRSYSTTLKNAQFLINVFTPRGHGSEWGGYSCGFKNHFGTYYPRDLHGNAGIVDINTKGPVYDKTVLNMVSALYANDPGTGPQQGRTDYSTYAKKMDATTTIQNPATIVVTTDPVAAEQQAIKIMKMNRNENYNSTDMPWYLNDAAYIGTIDEANMDIRTLLNGATDIVAPLKSKKQQIIYHVSASAVHGSRATHIQYALPIEHLGKSVSFEIFDAQGSMVRRLTNTMHGALTNFSWDQKTEAGHFVKSGIYAMVCAYGGTKLTTSFSVAH